MTRETTTPRSRAARLAVCGAALATGLALTPLSILSPTRAMAVGTPHVMVIVEENQGYNQVIGNTAQAPYINSLATTYASATRWYGLADLSTYDYVALIAGFTKVGASSGATLVGELAGAGVSWKGYMEDAPTACYTGGHVNQYTKTHNPFVYFTSITGNPAQCNQVVPFAGNFASDFGVSGSAPDFAFVVPNLCDDMHTNCGSGQVQQGDRWLQANLPTVMSSQWYASGGIIIITWDSALTSDQSKWHTGSGGHVPTIVVSATSHGSFTSGGNHYGTLRAIEEAYGVPLLGASSDAANGDLTPAF